MIWWKGNGLWLGTLVALIIIGANKTLGQFGLPLGFLSSALILLGLKTVFEDSSLYSVPYKAWPPVLFVLAALTFFTHR
jgi:hypothetical protein